jgi:REP element-mobilizing transposase RayT
MHQNYSLADTIRDLKHQSSLWMRNSANFIDFKGWSSEYFACSVSPRAQDAVIEYIKNQKEHHKKVTADYEYIKLLRNAGIPFNGFMPQ